MTNPKLLIKRGESGQFSSEGRGRFYWEGKGGKGRQGDIIQVAGRAYKAAGAKTAIVGKKGDPPTHSIPCNAERGRKE